MTAHKHAALMLQYAQDTMETDKPWERWEYSDTSTLNQHGEKICDDWYDCGENPDWHPGVQYRRKPQTIKVGKWEFPKPIGISEMPAIGTVLYLTKFSTAAEAFTVWNSEWDGDNCDMGWLKGGMLHFTREAAQAHADVLNAICRGDVE